MATTDRHGFLLWAAGFTQSDTILNDLLLKLEVKTGLSVISRTTDAQPATPAAGDCYIITATATGAQWAGFAANDVTIFRDSTWYAFTPIKGWPAWVEDAAEGVIFNGTVWAVTLVANAIVDADFAATEGFMRKTGAGAYVAHKSNLTAIVAPAVTDDSAAGYSVGSIWLDTVAVLAYTCTSAAVGAAVWTTSGLSQAQVDARVALYAPTSGTFTPTIQDNTLSDAESQTYTAAVGWYRRIGDLVFFWISITINSLGSLTGSETTKIAGLPYTAATGISSAVTVGIGDSLAITAGNALTGFVVSNTNYITVNKWSATTGTTGLTITELSTGGKLVLSGNYVAA